MLATPSSKSHHQKSARTSQSELLEITAAPADPGFACRLDVRTLMASLPVASVSEFARFAGVSRTTVYRWMRNGLDYWTADVLAIKVAHIHPALVFGPGWFELADTNEESAA
jgi:hypothetical protein